MEDEEYVEDEDFLENITEELLPIYESVLGKHNERDDVLKYLSSMIFRAETNQGMDLIISASAYRKKLEGKHKIEYESANVEAIFFEALDHDEMNGTKRGIFNEILRERYLDLRDMSGNKVFKYVSEHIPDVIKIMQSYFRDMEEVRDGPELQEYTKHVRILQELKPGSKNYKKMKKQSMGAMRYFGAEAGIERKNIEFAINQLLKKKN